MLLGGYAEFDVRVFTRVEACAERWPAPLDRRRRGGGVQRTGADAGAGTVARRKLPPHPSVASLRVIPVAGRDSMLLNLSGAHAPYFTRNLVVLTDSEGRTGVGEVPGGEPVRTTLEEARDLVVGQPVGDHHAVLRSVRTRFGASSPPTGSSPPRRRGRPRHSPRRALSPPLLKEYVAPWLHLAITIGTPRRVTPVPVRRRAADGLSAAARRPRWNPRCRPQMQGRRPGEVGSADLGLSE
ncbi:hypothetical protein GCM10010446_02720 [Streptomyces enissocaesilis]|uniref:Glucarate dehydratase n=1 Tax=Streptomyces enissocaesilis TaxID=332589 RepID=A0ABN3WPX2_9ACTN